MNDKALAFTRAFDRASTAAARAITPLMAAKAIAIGRKLDALAKRTSGPIVVGMSFAEAKRLAAYDAPLVRHLPEPLPILTTRKVA